MTRTRLRVFPAIPRNPNAAQHIDDLMRVARFGERNGLEGPLLFAGNDTLVEPWAMAQHILVRTEKISPLIAVNPLYMHPFTVAKFVSSFALLYRRKVDLNMITGTATSDLGGWASGALMKSDIHGSASSSSSSVNCWPAADRSLFRENITRRTICSYARVCLQRSCRSF